MSAKNAKKQPNNSVEFLIDDDYGITEAIATLDNGDFGTRTIRFETGQLARQAGVRGRGELHQACLVLGRQAQALPAVLAVGAAYRLLAQSRARRSSQTK